jgi:hypothetical protein
MCKSCPFNFGSESSESAQNLGCLPSAQDILKLKDETGHNWACHSNNKRVCSGLKKKRDTSSGKRYLAPGVNTDFISWQEKDLQPILVDQKIRA